MSTYLITGTSRGIGLELIKQFSELPASQVSKIFAVTRGPSQALENLISGSNGRIVNILIEDITNPENVQKGIAEVEKALEGKGLDVLVNNAGVMPFTPGSMKSVSGKELQEVFTVNVISAQVMTSAFLPLLEKGKEKEIMNISTSMGSIAYTKKYQFAPTHSYKISKAAMNMLTTQYAMDLEDQGFTCLAITPGWLKTDRGSQNADLDVSVGVAGVKDIILKAETSQNGKFVNIRVAGWESADGPNVYDGAEVPW